MWCEANSKNFEALKNLGLKMQDGIECALKWKANFYIKGIYVPNFILATKYEVNNYPALKKNTWQGYSINLGLGFDYSLSQKIQLTNSLTYSIANTVARDTYTFSQDEREIALTHNYLQLSAGVKVKL